MDKVSLTCAVLFFPLLLSTASATGASLTNTSVSTNPPVQDPWQLARTELASSEAAVVVTTSSWEQVAGQARLYIRDRDHWQQTATFPVVVGRNGLGWGIGVGDFRPVGIPVKREGDGKGPAGVFRLRQSFGSQGAIGALPYLAVEPSHVCVDDSKSQFYNRIIDERQAAKDWDSFERMLIAPYRLGIEVAHNYDTPVAGGGSCIFMHLWQGPNQGTAGCTAMSESSISELLNKMPSKTLLVQLPESQYAEYADTLGLPHLPRR
jgi:zinc D-Ala-D-Ala dipeptidase